MDEISPADLWSLELEEEANFLALLGLASVTGEDNSTTLTDLWSKDSMYMMDVFSPASSSSEEEEGEANFLASLGLGSISSSEDNSIGDAVQYQFDKVGDSQLISSSPSIGSTPQLKELSVYQEQDTYVSVEEDNSWSMEEEHMLRAAMSDYIFMHPIIPWQRIAESLPSRAPSEVFNRANQLLQTLQSQLSTFTTDKQQHMSPQQKQRPRKRWSEEEHKKFLVGVETYGWGNWKMVATLIPGTTVPQVTSHAQGYQNHNNPKRRRRISSNL